MEKVTAVLIRANAVQAGLVPCILRKSTNPPLRGLGRGGLALIVLVLGFDFPGGRTPYLSELQGRKEGGGS